MEFLGVGPMELLLILVIALIVLGPNDMVKTGRMLGRFLRRIVTSPLWRTVQDTSHNLRSIPTQLMREAGLEEEMAEVQQIGRNLEKETQMLNSLRQGMRPDAPADNTSLPGLSAWTTTQPDPSEAPRPAGAGPLNLSAWTTPPSQPAEVFTPPEEPPAPPAQPPASRSA